MQLSSRAHTLRPSPTLAIDARAKELIREGVDIVNLGAGEPDFDTPVSVVNAAHAAARAGKTKYTGAAGIPELREAIAAHVTKTHGVAVRATQVVVTNGAKQALFDALQALVDPGDEVVVFAPYWVSYPDLVVLSGGTMVRAPVSEGTQEPDLTALERCLTPRTKGMIVNTPNNPTGAVYSRRTIEGLVALCREQGLWILSDEIYERLVFDGLAHVSPASVGSEGFERTILASGFSKSYAMTGWRLGYLVGPENVAAAATTIQSQVTGSVNTPTQWAAIEALRSGSAEQQRMVAEFEARRSLVVSGLREALGSGVKVPEPRGAFYVLFDVRPFLGRSFEGRRLDDDAALVDRLLERARVATVPGSAFGQPGFVRMSYATSRENLTKALGRMRAFFAAVK